MATAIHRYKVIGKIVGQYGTLFKYESLDRDETVEVTGVSRCSVDCSPGVTTLLPLDPGDVFAIFSKSTIRLLFDDTTDLVVQGFLIMDNGFTDNVKVLQDPLSPTVRVDALSIAL